MYILRFIFSDGCLRNMFDLAWLWGSLEGSESRELRCAASGTRGVRMSSGLGAGSELAGAAPITSTPATALGFRARTPLSRDFLCDLARLAEGLVMCDVTDDFFGAVDGARADDDAHCAELVAQMGCREQAAWFAPDSVGDLKQRADADSHFCEVRRRRAEWAVAIKRNYPGARVVRWVDTGVDLEKAALVISLRAGASSRAGASPSASSERCVSSGSGATSVTPASSTPPVSSGPPPLIVVVFRGSKSTSDYIRTDASPRFIPLGTPEAYGPDDSKAELMPSLGGSSMPCVSRGAWRAYAGVRERDEEGVGPRALVRDSVEALLREDPRSELVITGHSLGGSIATLCAYDLIASSQTVSEAGATLVSFAAPRLFNKATTPRPPSSPPITQRPPPTPPLPPSDRV